MDSTLPASAGNHTYIFDLQKMDLNFANGLFYVILEVETGGKIDRHVLKELILR